MTGEEIAARARALVGVRFRAQGRSAEAGLDCVGLVAAALGVEPARSDYGLRGGSVAELERALAEAGLSRAAERRIGDVLVMRAGPEQLHLGIWTGSGIVHADVGLRRVVERPGPPEWGVIGVWGVDLLTPSLPRRKSGEAPLHHVSHGSPPLQKQGRN